MLWGGWWVAYSNLVSAPVPFCFRYYWDLVGVGSRGFWDLGLGTGLDNYFLSHTFKELVGWLGQATADFTVLGGDFNTDPRDNETSYSDLKSLMVSK